MIEIIPFKDEETWLNARLQDITSTEVSALFGLSPYSTPFELWHRKKDAVVVKLDPNDRMRWGSALQDAIAEEVAKENGWTIRKMTEYIRNPEWRMGSSFDFAIGDAGLMEVKNVDGLVFKNEWTQDENGNISAPLHIEIQVQHELAVSGRDHCYIAALVGGNKDVLIKRTRDHAVIEAIIHRVKEFWVSIESNTPPPPDYQADAEFIGKLFGYAEPGKVLDVTADEQMLCMAREYKELGDAIKVNTERRDAIKAELLTKVGDAEKVLGLGFSIDCGITGACHMDFDRAAFRRFTLRFKKEKKA